MARFNRATLIASGVFLSALLHGCAPPTVYRSSRPPLASLPPQEASTLPRPSPPPAIAVPTEEAKSRAPVLSESDIREQDLERSRLAGTTPEPFDSPPVKPAIQAQESAENIVLRPSIVGEIDPGQKSTGGVAAVPEEATRDERREKTDTIRPEEPLIAMISPNTPPRSALSLRLAEEGRKLLESQEYNKGLARLERAISMDSRNRFAYYYLAEAHHALGRQSQSLNFLEIVLYRFADQPVWLARVYALQGKNYEALGFIERADESYLKALKLDPRNRVALEGLSKIK